MERYCRGNGGEALNKKVESFMAEKGYSGVMNAHGIRKDYKRRVDWEFKSLAHVLDEFRLWHKHLGK